MTSGGAAAPDDRVGGEAPGKAFLLHLLRRPPPAEPTAAPLQAQPQTPTARLPNFHFLPHTLIPPRPPSQPAEPPPPPPPAVEVCFPTVRVPIPRDLPPGPWEPLEISPSLLADCRTSHESESQPEDAGDRNALRGSNTRSNHRPQHQNAISNQIYDNRRNSCSWGRAKRSAAYGRAGYGNGTSGGNARVDRRFDDQRNAHGGPSKSSSMQNTHGMGFQYEKKRMILKDHWHSISWQPKATEQRGQEGSAQKQKVKAEWIAVTRRQDEKHKLESGHNSQQEVEDEVLQTQTCNHLDQIECSPESNYLPIEESDANEAANGLLPEAFKDGNSPESELEKPEEPEDFSEGGASQEDALPEKHTKSLELKGGRAQRKMKRHSQTSPVERVGSILLRGQQVSSRRMRNSRRQIECRPDIDGLTSGFLSVYESLIPADDEKDKQNQLFQSIAKSINKEWPNAKLHLYGSCANSFGFSKSDIDICLAIDDSTVSKLDILLKLADVLQSKNFEDVKAITNARVPIVKMMDPQTGISCDICINNLLAVMNTRLLRDYALIDDRLHQLAFIVKHWARSREVNETYQGTLSSYAYVLMCIHFLQLRKPAILPCLQEMETTYVLTVEDTECAYFDQVDKLQNFGAQNKESIAQLIWEFFQYWAYYHNYKSDVISIRTGTIISKEMKNWTRRIGNDRHLFCIEDPFEISHDLGRVVDRSSIKILREEFERAADMLQYEPNPHATLFEPYEPSLMQN